MSPAGRYPKVDALFEGEPPAPPPDPGPALRRLRVLLAVAIPLDLLGIPCWTGVPGAVLTLWAWLRADAEAARVREGAYDDDLAADFLRLRAWAAWALGFSILSLVVQAWLLTTPFYALLLVRALDALGLG